MSRGGGNPRCDSCHGAGGKMVNGSWRRCSCTRPTQAQADAMRRFNEGDRPFSLDFLKGDKPK